MSDQALDGEHWIKYVTQRSDERWQASCTCGWKSSLAGTPEAAAKEADRHAMRVLVVPADPHEPIREKRIARDDSLHDLQQLVGGLIQSIPWEHAGEGRVTATTYFNEEGKFAVDPRTDERFAPNARATLLHLGTLFVGDWIAGDLVIAGLDNSDGETVPLPKEWTIDRLERLITTASVTAPPMWRESTAGQAMITDLLFSLVVHE